MSTLIPNIPFRTPISDSTGLVNQAWLNWFRDLFTRTGSGLALSNIELEDQISGSSFAVQVATLEANVLLLQTQVASLNNATDGLGQGPVL